MKTLAVSRVALALLLLISRGSFLFVLSSALAQLISWNLPNTTAIADVLNISSAPGGSI